MTESIGNKKYLKGSTTSADTMDSFLLFLAAKGFKPDLVFDVGAAKGAWAEMARSAFPSAHVHMFEPLSSWQGDLETMCAKLGNAEFTQAAVGAEAGVVEMERHEIATRSLVPLPGRVSDNPTEKVAVVCVDDIMAQHYDNKPLGLLKVDVQGYEMPVLDGAARTLKSCEVVILECSLFPFFGANTPIFNDIYNRMTALGFVLFDIPTLMRRSDDHALGQIDACFVKAGSALRDMRPHVAPFEWPAARPVSRIPVQLVFGRGFYSAQFDDDREWRWSAEQGYLFIVNQRSQPLKIRLTAQVTLASPSPGELRYSFNGEERALACSGTRNMLDLELSLAPNSTTEVLFHGPANITMFSRAVSFRLINYVVRLVK